jgi:hypothetical protein
MNRPRLSLLLFLPIFSLSCKSTTPPTATPVVEVQAHDQKFENQSAGISFMYPSAWKVVSTDPTQFRFVQNGKGETLELTLDVPKLPWHIPGLIPIDSVRDGYVDDVKKRMAGAKVTNLPDPALPDAKQHRVQLTGQINGKPAVNDAVMIVHNDKVYILSIETDPAAYPQLKEKLDAVIASLKWIR